MDSFRWTRNHCQGRRLTWLVLAVMLLSIPLGALAIDDDQIRLLKGDISENLENGDDKTLYTVKKGDSLWSIARNHKMSLETLIELNHLTGKSLIHPGMELVVEGAAKGTKPRQEEDRLLLFASAKYPEGSRGAVLSGFRWPIIGAITSPFGLRQDPNRPSKEVFHHGLDIAGNSGDPIRATGKGEVTFVGTKPIYGKTVIIQHGDGVKTVYAHLQKYNVAKGDKVQGGDVIGYCGETGVATGPHLHLEVHVDGQVVNPVLYLKGGASR